MGDTVSLERAKHAALEGLFVQLLALMQDNTFDGRLLERLEEAAKGRAVQRARTPGDLPPIAVTVEIERMIKAARAAQG